MSEISNFLGVDEGVQEKTEDQIISLMIHIHLKLNSNRKTSLKTCINEQLQSRFPLLMRSAIFLLMSIFHKIT